MSKDEKYSHTYANKNDEAPISFKRNKKKHTIQLLSKSAALVAVSIVTGIITSNVIVDKKLEELGLTSSIKKDITVEEQNLNYIYLSEIISKVGPSLVSISDDTDKLKKNGYNQKNVTGVIIDNEGYIVTSYSSIKSFGDIYVKLSSVASSIQAAKLIGSYEQLDIAVIKIEGGNYPVSRFANDKDIRAGDRVISLGNASANDYVGFVSSGIINSTSLTLDTSSSSKEQKIFKSIQNNTIVNEENNGGPLCNLNGEIIGINSLDFIDKHSKYGLSVVVGGSELESIIRAIIDTGNAEKMDLGFIGGATNSLNEEGIVGIYVEWVYPESSVANAGIRPTDIIIELDNQKIRSIDDIDDIIKKHNIGDDISCRVLRGAENIDLVLTLVKYKLVL